MTDTNATNAEAIVPPTKNPVASDNRDVKLTDALAAELAAKTKADELAAIAQAERDALADRLIDAQILLEANGFTVTFGAPAATPRTSGHRMEMADPKVVRAYFQSTGLAMKDIAAIVGVTRSVISTVQSDNGDRWSVETFNARVKLIDAVIASRKAMADDLAAARARRAQ